MTTKARQNTIIEQRKQIEQLLRDSPSLKNVVSSLFFNCYQDGRELVIRKSRLTEKIFPNEPPFSIEDILNPDYLPE